MVAPGPVDLEIAARKPFALEAVALEQRDRGRVVRDAGRLDPVQPQFAESEFDHRRDRARHAPLAGVRRAHPVAERAGLRHAAADAAERDAADQLLGRLVENEEGVGLVAGHVLLLALEPPPEGRLRQVVVRPGRLPRLEEGAARRPEPRPGGEIRRRRRTQIEPVATQQRLGIDRSCQAEKRHQTPLSASATWARPGTLATAPIVATVGGDLSMAAPVLRTSSAEMASTRAIISSSDRGRP